MSPIFCFSTQWPLIWPYSEIVDSHQNVFHKCNCKDQTECFLLHMLLRGCHAWNYCCFVMGLWFLALLSIKQLVKWAFSVIVPCILDDFLSHYHGSLVQRTINSYRKHKKHIGKSFRTQGMVTVILPPIWSWFMHPDPGSYVQIGLTIYKMAMKA